MTKLTMAVAALIVGVMSLHFAAAQKEEAWVVVQAAGQERAAFIPAAQPYTEGGPAVSVYLMNRKDVRTKEGLIVTGFEFIGWREASTNRVLVFALVPREGVPNTYMPDGDVKNLRRVDFATHTVAPGQSLPINEMKTLGIEPMVLRAILKRPSSSSASH